MRKYTLYTGFVLPRQQRSGLLAAILGGGLCLLLFTLLNVGSLQAAQSPAPQISSILDQEINEDDIMGPITFTLSDGNDAAASLIVSYLLTNTTLVPVGHVAITQMGDGSIRSIQITPADEQSGEALIVLMVRDPSGNTGQTAFTLKVNPVDDTPTIAAVADQEVQAGKTSGLISVTLNDVDTPLTALSLGAVAADETLIPPTSLILGGSGGSRTLEIRPPADLVGSTVVTLTAGDATTSAFLVFTVDVVPANQPPVISAIEAQEIDEDGSLTVEFTVADVETPEVLSPLAFSDNQSLVPNENMVVTGSGFTRTLHLTPKADRTGESDITLSITDGEYPVVSTFHLTVIAQNDPPTIADIPKQSMNEDTVLAVPFTVGDVDTPLDQLTVTATILDPTIDATLTLVRIGANGVITVTPAANQSGSLVVLLTVTDGDSVPVFDTFFVEVRAVNDLPTVVSFDPIITLEDRASDPQTFVVQDLDSPINTIVVTATSADTNIVLSENITLTQNELQPAQWSITIMPNANAFGSVNITLHITDEDGGVGTYQFRFTVEPLNDRPVISDIPDITTAEDTTATADFVANDIETPSVQLLYKVSSSNPSLLAPSNAQVSNTSNGQRLTLKPTANMFGTAVITVTVEDNLKSSASDSFLFTVTPVNDAPLLSALPDISTAESMTATLTFTVNDPDNDLSGLGFGFASSNTLLMPSANIEVIGAETTRQLILTPKPGLYGKVAVTMTVSDGSDSVMDSFLLTVNALPTISSISEQTAAEDEPVSVPFTIDDRDTAVTQLQLSADTSNTGLVPRANLLFEGIGNQRSLRITPAPDLWGSCTITITVNDGTYKSSTAFHFTVTPVDDPPSIDGVSDQIIDQDGQLALLFKVRDVDTAADQITVTPDSSNRTLVPVGNIQIAGASTDRTVTVHPAPGRSGVARITLTANDGTSRSSTDFELRVNGPPGFGAIGSVTMMEDSIKVVNITVGDPDTPAADLQVTSLVSDTRLIPADGVEIANLGASRILTITPGPDAVGTTAITLTVTDGRLSVRRVVPVTITPVNDAPTVSPIGDQIIDEETVAGPIPFSVDDIDTDPQAFTVYGSSSDTKLVPHTNITFDGTGKARSVTVAPLPNVSGQVVISVTVSDGNLLATSAFSVTVRSVNDPPTISPIGPRESQEDEVISITLNINDLDTPIDELTLSGRSVNPGLVSDSSLIFSGSGKQRTLTITPEADQSGPVSLSVLVSDGSLTAQTSFTLTILNVNDGPLIDPIEDQAVDEDTRLVLPLKLHDIDTPPDLLSLTVTSSDGRLVPASSIRLEGQGPERTLTITPVRNGNGMTRIDLTLDDGELTDTQSFLLKVFPINDPPDAVDDVYTIITLPAASFGVVANDFDVDRDPLKVIGVSTALFGAVTINRDNTILYTMPPKFVGQDVFSYTVSDGQGEEDAATVTVNVVEPPGPNTPEIYEVEPPAGLNDRSQDITIGGINLEPGATVQLGPYPLSNIRVNGAQTSVVASVPAFLPPARYDVIVTNGDGRAAVRTSAYSVETDKISLISVRPNRGQVDLPVQINVYGLNFDAKAVAYIDDKPLATSFISPKHLQAVVLPDSVAPGRHAVTVINDDGQKFTVADAYTVYTADSDDLFAYEYEMWTLPATLHTGQSVQLGLHVRRQVGSTVLSDVEVDFYINVPYNEDTYVGRAFVPLLLPADDVNSETVTWTPPSAGSYTIYAVIDPRRRVPEIHEDNNLIRRTVTVLPTKVDMQGPAIDRLSINNGAATTQSTAISITVSANDADNPIRAIYLVEYEYIGGADQWVPVQWSDWLTYTDTPTRFAWTLLSSPGIKYIQAWAADERGNAMSTPALAAINYVPIDEDWVDGGEVRLYRYSMQTGDRLSAFLFPTEGDPDLYVWPPDYELRDPWITNLSKGVDEIGFVAPRDGPYQLEISGYTGSRYRTSVELRTFDPRAVEGAGSRGNIDPAKQKRGQPYIPVFDMPALEYRLSSALPAREIGLPPMVKPIYLPFVTRYPASVLSLADAESSLGTVGPTVDASRHLLFLPWTNR